MEGLKLLMTEQDLHNLKKLSLELQKYNNEVLKPFQATISGEIRRYLTIHKRMDAVIKEGEGLVRELNLCLGEK